MMNDVLMPSNPLDEECKEACDEMCEGCTISEIRAMGDYLYKKANELSQIAETDLTIEDFEDIKKQDLDNDQGKGESHGY